MMCRSLINTWRASLLITSLMAILEAGTTCRPICRGLPVGAMVRLFTLLLQPEVCSPNPFCTVQSTFQGLHATHNEACHCRLILGHHKPTPGVVCYRKALCSLIEKKLCMHGQMSWALYVC